MKYIGLFILGLMGVSAYATAWDDNNCTNRGGIIATAKNGDTFCRSKVQMNWYSASVWCQKHGGALANNSKACFGTALSVKSSCANLYDGAVVTYAAYWLGVTAGEEVAWTVNRGAAATDVTLQNRKHTASAYALCE